MKVPALRVDELSDFVKASHEMLFETPQSGILALVKPEKPVDKLRSEASLKGGAVPLL